MASDWRSWRRERLRWWFGGALIALGIVGTALAPAALISGARGGSFILVGGLAIMYLGWLALPRRPHLAAEARKAWRAEGPWGISTGERLFVYVGNSAVFVLVGFMWDWLWAAIVSIATYFAWFAIRVRGRR